MMAAATGARPAQGQAQAPTTGQKPAATPAIKATGKAGFATSNAVTSSILTPGAGSATLATLMTAQVGTEGGSDEHVRMKE